MQLRNTSKHRPKDMIIDVDEKDAEEIMKIGGFVELEKIQPKEEVKYEKRKISINL